MEIKKSKLEKNFAKFSLALITFAAVLLVVTMMQIGDTKYAVKETAAYTRVSSCIISKSGTELRTAKGVEECYVQVEKDSGIPLERFDQQVNGEWLYEDN